MKKLRVTIKNFLLDVYARKIKYLQTGLLAFLGFLLSPLSWWNDLLVNIPLAYAFAWVLARFCSLFFDVSKSLFIVLAIIGYFMTNLVGFLLIHLSIVSVASKNKIKISQQIAVSFLYTLLIVALIYFDVFRMVFDVTMIPSWVK